MASLHNLLLGSKALPFIGGLIVSYKFVELAVMSILIDYLTDSWGKDNQKIAAVVINVQDGLSSIVFVFVSLISEEYTRCFTMIAYCVPLYIMGLVLLWASTLPSALGAVYAALVLLLLHKVGQNLSESFLEYQLQDHMSTISMKLCLFMPSAIVYIITVCIAFAAYDETTYRDRFKFVIFLMSGTYVFYLLGYFWYDHESPIKGNLHKIYTICKAALGKWELKYPNSLYCYYWKGYKQEHLYEVDGRLRLLPRVPRLFRWLDKAAIVRTEGVSPLMQENNGKLCTVREVREVKSLVPMIYLGFTLFGYSFLLATGNTFFVSQASSSESSITENGNDTMILFLIKDVMCNNSRFIYFLILQCLIKLGVVDSLSRRRRKTATIIRVGVGMFCALISCIIAWRVEVVRLSREINTTVALIPQFILLGMAEGLVDRGFMSLFYGHVVESMWGFADSFIELVIGIGKILVTPLVLIFSTWFIGNYDNSHLDRYFLMLGFINAMFLTVFAYYSMTYAYKEVCPEDQKVTMMDQTAFVDSYQEIENEKQLEDNVMATTYELLQKFEDQNEAAPNQFG